MSMNIVKGGEAWLTLTVGGSSAPWAFSVGGGAGSAFVGLCSGSASAISRSKSGRRSSDHTRTALDKRRSSAPEA